MIGALSKLELLLKWYSSQHLPNLDNDYKEAEKLKENIQVFAYISTCRAITILTPFLYRQATKLRYIPKYIHTYLHTKFHQTLSIFEQQLHRHLSPILEKYWTYSIRYIYDMIFLVYAWNPKFVRRKTTNLKGLFQNYDLKLKKIIPSTWTT